MKVSQLMMSANYAITAGANFVTYLVANGFGQSCAKQHRLVKSWHFFALQRGLLHDRSGAADERAERGAAMT